MDRHVFVQAIVLEKDPQTGDVVVRAITNQGRFIIGNDIVDPDITGNFYTYIRGLAVEEVEKILASETKDAKEQKLKETLKAVVEKQQPSA